MMNRNKLDRLFAEGNVRNYKFYELKLEQERRDIISATPIYDNNGGGKTNIPSRPTEKMAMALMENSEKWQERIKYMDAIAFALSELSEGKKRQIHCLYWSGDKDIQTICTECNISKSTLKRRKDDFLDRVCELVGY